jgi:hypothetical protein
MRIKEKIKIKPKKPYKNRTKTTKNKGNLNQKT